MTTTVSRKPCLTDERRKQGGLEKSNYSDFSSIQDLLREPVQNINVNSIKQ